jgi:hypothetical protein
MLKKISDEEEEKCEEKGGRRKRKNQKISPVFLQSAKFPLSFDWLGRIRDVSQLVQVKPAQQIIKNQYFHK